ncbi:MAG: hypothetical protein IJU23_00570 [Proteobacteria bacterium]|nr:hypothetical protein [Pseudomonadota bacterium]
MWKKSFILASLLSLMPSISMAQTALDAFLNRVVEASSLSSCEETEKALAAISEHEFESAQADMKLLKHESELSRYAEQFGKIGELSARCPAIQDKFAGRLSLFAVHSKLNEKSGDFGAIQRFVDWCEGAIAEDCEASAKKLGQFPDGMCAEAVTAFQTVKPTSVSDADYRAVSSKMEKILSWSSSCAAYKQVYEACLMPADKEYRQLSELDPLFAYLKDLKQRLDSTFCQDMPKFKDNVKLRLEASNALKGLKPSQFSPADRDKIRSAMDDLYKISDKCPAAHDVIDNAIESLFPSK